MEGEDFGTIPRQRGERLAKSTMDGHELVLIALGEHRRKNERVADATSYGVAM